MSEELLAVNVYQALTILSPLRRGIGETDPVMPVSREHVETIRPLVSRQVRALIDLQLLTGSRAGELVGLRAMDIDRTGEIWTATLKHHKTAHRSRPRIIVFGVRAQAVLKDLIEDRYEQDRLFSPQDARREFGQAAATHRRPDQKPNPKKTDRVVGDHYTVASYRKAIERACDAAGIPRWTPHRLRHTVATEIRAKYGLEAAQIILGHANADVTQIYAEADFQRAIEIARKIG